MSTVRIVNPETISTWCMPFYFYPERRGQMTPASSIAFFRPEFDEFLHAPIGADGNDMPLSVLSALTRLNIDPWEEAAELSELPKKAARERLALSISRLPGGRWTPTDVRAIADRLVELLPHLDSSKMPLAGMPSGVREMIRSTGAKMLVLAVLLAAALIIATSRESSLGNLPDTPASTTSLPQTPPDYR